VPRDYFTSAQACERLNVSPDLLGDLIRLGGLKAIDVRKPGARRASYRISAAAMAEFEKARAAKPVAMPGREARTRKRAKVAAGFRQYF
jgi:hypothetical protein